MHTLLLHPPTAKKQNILLLGESGAGKSLFLIKLMQEILKEKSFKNHLVAFYKLIDL
jgi:DNA replication protein DnaC